MLDRTRLPGLWPEHAEPSVTWFDADNNSELALAPDFQSFIEDLTSASGFENVRSDGSFG
ncbi:MULTISPECIES: hypothetical protein [Streptomyces]|uniref:SMI1/KNR4 family protein n=1 Tax=Streptomyces glycanivorans TaxID=3033808 RepID=A0ABY9JP96_9ACTN|nr:hypothetical protein [Streptomyces sp. Alt3]WLQ69413.1 hypothetical protein P8A20_37615 [Streptomyces sp. Alt3]